MTDRRVITHKYVCECVEFVQSLAESGKGEVHLFGEDAFKALVGLEYLDWLKELAHRAGKDDVMGESDFEFALRLLKAGKRVAREGWNGKGQWIVMMPGLKLPPFSSQEPGAKVNDRTAKHIGVDTPLDSQPYIALWNAQGKWQPGWVPSQGDLFADDWVEVQQ